MVVMDMDGERKGINEGERKNESELLREKYDLRQVHIRS